LQALQAAALAVTFPDPISITLCCSSYVPVKRSRPIGGKNLDTWLMNQDTSRSQPGDPSGGRLDPDRPLALFDQTSKPSIAEKRAPN